MKKILFVFAACALTFAGCGTNNDGNGDGGNQVVEAVSAKWQIADPSCPFESFEFSKDNTYIVVERQSGLRGANIDRAGVGQRGLFGSLVGPQSKAGEDSGLSPVHAGRYTIDGNRITLIGFGVLEIIEVTAEEFNFSFTLTESGDTGTYVADKTAEPISQSTLTDQLCRTWEIIGFEGDDDPEYLGATVLFSRAGTYLMLYTDGTAGLSEWKWKSEANKTFYYSWNNWTETQEELDRYNVVYIDQITSSRLVLREEIEFEEGESYTIVWTLKPVN